MKTKTTYAGVTTELSDNLFEKPKVYKKKPRKSNKFGAMSLYYDGIYYFPSDIKESDKREDKPFEIQGVYYRGKWYQDTFYITREFRNFLLSVCDCGKPIDSRYDPCCSLKCWDKKFL